MRRSMFVLSLIAVLAGTPLRLAEAADDLARSLAESSNGVNLEQADGGVGDDSGATINPEVLSNIALPVVEQILLALPCLSPHSRAINEHDRWNDSLLGGLINPRRTCAWFQRFRC